MTFLLSILTSLLLAASDLLSFDSISYDFGSQPKSVESLTHDFVFTNTSSRAVRISYAVVTCSCTTLKWTTESVKPGGTGFVRATYERERNADYFEKFISVFLEGRSKPYVLRISGHFYETDDILSSEFPVRRSSIGFKSSPYNIGDVHAGSIAKNSFWVANFSSEYVTLSFKNLSDSLHISPLSVSLDPLSRKQISLVVGVDTLSWGRRIYHAVPVVAGKAQESVSFALTATQDFSSLTSKQRDAGPLPKLEGGCSFGSVRPGRKAHVAFTVKNVSRSQPLFVRAVFSDIEGLSFDVPSSIPPGESAVFKVTIPSKALVRGANEIMIHVQSNSPLRQVMDVALTGNVE